MQDTALTAYQFTIVVSIAEWLEQKKTRTRSEKIRSAYTDTISGFRQILSQGKLDLLDNPIDVARVAALWANMRMGKTRQLGEDVSLSTYNQRLAILSSWYTFVREVYKQDFPNPIESVKKPVYRHTPRLCPLQLKLLSKDLRASIGTQIRARAIMLFLPLLFTQGDEHMSR